MIIRSYTRRGPQADIHQLIKYISHPGKAVSRAPMIAFNLSTPIYDHHAIAGEMKANIKLCRRQAKNSVQICHDIISLHASDSAKANPQMLFQMAVEWLQQKKALILDENGVPIGGAPIYGVIQNHGKSGKTGRFHVHLVYTPNHVGKDKRQRLTVYDFRRALDHMQDFQSRHYPELEHSVIHHRFGRHAEEFKKEHGHWPNPRLQRAASRRHDRQVKAQHQKERQAIKKHQVKPKLTKLQELQVIVRKCLDQSSSKEQFISRLRAQELHLKFRSRQKKIVSIEDRRGKKSNEKGKSYRFGARSLNLLDEFKTKLHEWQRTPSQWRRYPERDLEWELVPGGGLGEIPQRD